MAHPAAPLGGLHSCSGVTNEYSDLFLAHVGATGRMTATRRSGGWNWSSRTAFAPWWPWDHYGCATLALYARALARGLLR